MTKRTPFCGIMLAAVALSGVALAQSSLTTIQDTLFKADGTRFNGTLNIQWNTFDATNVGTVIQQSKAVTVVNGSLQVQLAPNANAAAPANVYMVHYQSDGSQQFTETWTVPPSAQAMTVASVRTGTLTGSGGQNAGNQTPILESTVVGLTSDLAVRPIKGPGFGTGSVAVINENGQIETAIGNIGDCVYVDGTAGACGGQTSTFFDAETPGGIVDGTNATFTLANSPGGSSLMLFRNGLYMKAGFDYNLTAGSLTFVTGAVPQPGDTLVASYRVDPSSGNIGAIRQPGAPHSSTLAQVLCSAVGRTNSTVTWAELGSCDVPAGALLPGNRIEVHFNFSHAGTASAFDFLANWGTLTILQRHAGAQDTAVVGNLESSISAAGAQITAQSWGTVLSFLPGIVSSPQQPGVKIVLKGRMSQMGSDFLSLTSYTVLLYPAL